jgi:putative ABC transport system permease protein
VNLAFHDVKRNAGRFLGTGFGLSLLFTVVLAMAGIYQGLVEDATVLRRSLRADLWVVQQGTRGPFADISRLDPSVEGRLAAVTGVKGVRAMTYQVLERDVSGRQLRFTLVGLSWPDGFAVDLPLLAGRTIGQAHGEVVVDRSLGLPVGSRLSLAHEELQVVGLADQVLGSGGDAVVFATLADAQLILADVPGDSVRTERERRAERVRATDLGRSQPALESLAVDPTWRLPALAPAPVAAVLVDLSDPARLAEVQGAIRAWPDVTAYSAAEEDRLLLDGVVDKARRQLGLFGVILVLTSSVLIAAVVYTMTLDKTHTIAVLKLMGAPRGRIAGMVLQQALLMGLLGYALAVALGTQVFPYFPRRVILGPGLVAAVGLLVLVVSTASSLLGVRYALRVDAGRALEG